MKKESSKLSRKAALFLDALNYSFQMVNFQKKEIDRLLEILEHTEAIEGEYETDAIQLTLNLWGLIDSGHRIREIVQQLPGLKKRGPEIQLFIRNTESVEDLRHYIQHLRNGIHTLPESSSPLWGVISWVSQNKPDTCFTILTGSAPDINIHSCAYDTWNKEFGEKLILSVNNYTVEIADLVKRIENLRAFIHRWAKERAYRFEKRRLPIFKFVASK